MIIGRFTEHDDGSICGVLSTLLIAYKPIALVANSTKKGDKEPDYIVQYNNADSPFDVGAAWKRVGKDGITYMSVKFDGPGLDAPIFARLVYAVAGQNALNLEWIRETKGEA